MNKQEAIEQLEWNVVRTTDFDRAEDVVVFEKAKEIISQIHEPQKVVVPKFIADSIEYCKNKEGYGLLRAMDYCDEYNDTGEWLEHNQETFALAWLFSYEIEREKLYTVELFNGQPLVEEKNILYFSSDLAASNAHVGKDKLEAAGFGWVFDCNGVKVVEVKND
ncbi:DUF1642 domain-containing protein [Streptococcus suis]|uniref:DUF1642 domain-containing protein n=1 Tax=Streptococcus suis TaxID=1307 RepID=UPI000CF5B1A6|nr:DUF1642 domain-containing protein [Streptococcus suis]